MDALHEVVADVGEHAAERGGDAGEPRYQHGGHTQLAGDGRRVHRARAAEGEERELARVVPLVDRDEASRPGHLVVDDAHHGGGGFDRVEAERLADLLPHDPCNRVDVGGRFEPRDGPGVDAAQQQVGIGDGRLAAPPAVADGAGRRARALRTDPQQPAVVDPGDAAAARADGLDVHHRHPERHSVADVLLRRRRGRATAHDGDIEARPAHVATDDVGKARRAAEMGGRDGTGGGTGHHRLHRLLTRDARRHHAAVALHHQQVVREATGPEAALEVTEVARHDRLDVAVEGRRAAAFELAHLAKDVGTEGDVALRPDLARDRTGAPLVIRIEVRVEEADDDRFHAQVAERFDRATYLVLIQRGHDVAAGVDPFGHLETPVAGHDRFEVTEHAPGVGARAPAELEGVAEAPGRDHPAAHAAALEHRVGADRRAVDDRLERARVDIERRKPVHEAVRLIGGRGAHLRDAKSARGGVGEQQVGERASDIDAKNHRSLPVTHRFLAGGPSLSGRPLRMLVEPWR